MHTFEVAPDTQRRQVVRLVAAALGAKYYVMGGHVVTTADWAGARVSIALIDVTVLVLPLARDDRSPDHEKVLAQAADQPASWMLASEGPGNRSVQKERRLAEPQAQAYVSYRQPVTGTVRKAPAETLGRLAGALARGPTGAATPRRGRVCELFVYGCLSLAHGARGAVDWEARDAGSATDGVGAPHLTRGFAWRAIGRGTRSKRVGKGGGVLLATTALDAAGVVVDLLSGVAIQNDGL